MESEININSSDLCAFCFIIINTMILIGFRGLKCRAFDDALLLHGVWPYV